MIIKRIESTQKRRAAETASYIMDAQHDGEKLLAAGAVNTFAANLDDAQKEMSADETAYSGEGNAVAHWMVSWRDNENPTPEQMQAFATDFLRDQGMTDHKAVWALHGNTNNTHGHIAVLRVRPEPEDGKYKVQNFGGRVLRTNGTTHEVQSARATVIDFCQRHGFQADFENVGKKPRDKDSIELTQRQSAAKAQTGQKPPVELMGETARDIIRGAKSWREMHDGLIRHGISFRIQDHTDTSVNGGKYRQWGVLYGPRGEKLTLGKLPPDCRLHVIVKRFGLDGQGQIADVDAPKTAASNAFYVKTLTANSAKAQARRILADAGSFGEAEKLLGQKGMSIERQGKQGAYLIYGSGDDQRMKLSALGGKYSLHALSKRYADSDHILSLKYASSIPTDQLKVNGKVNGLSMPTLAERADRASSRATTADARAVSIAGEAVQAKTLAEALDDADAQAAALDAARRAHAQAARAEARAEQAEAREKTLRQQLKEKNAMMDLKPAKPTTPAEETPAPTTTTIEESAKKTENPTYGTDEKETALKTDTTAKPDEKIDISLDLCDFPAPIGIADNPAQDNAQTGSSPRLR